MKSDRKENLRRSSTVQRKQASAEANNTVQPGKEGRVPDPSAKPKNSRAISKSAAILSMLRRPYGATLKELMQASNWQAHSVRGFLSGTVRKKLRLNLASRKRKNGERFYRITIR